jgi:cell division protein FtsB
MKRVFPSALLVVVAILSFAAIFAGESYGRLRELSALLSSQKDSNQRLKDNVTALKQEVFALEHDSRTLEKAARNELVLARPDEMVFIFEDKEINRGK